MKTDKFILAALVISGVLALGGCSNDNEPQPQSSFPADGQVRITTGIDDLTTRAGTTTNNLANQAIGFFFVTEGSDEYTYSNVKMEFKDGSWVATAASDGTASAPVMYWKDKETTVTVTAYAPWKANMTLQDKLKYEGIADQSTPEAVERADLLLYKSTKVNPATDLTTDGEISLTLTHMLTKMVLALTMGEDVKEAVPGATITDVRIKGLVKDGTISWDGGMYIRNLNTFSTIVPYKASEPDPLTGTTTYEAILYSQSVDASQFSVEVTLSDRKTYDKTYVYTLDEQYNFFANTPYTLPIKVGKSSPKVSFLKTNITADAWDTDGTDLGNKTID